MIVLPDSVVRQIASSAAEVARLREALEQIAYEDAAALWPDGTKLGAIARAALARDPSQDRETPAVVGQGVGVVDSAAPTSPDDCPTCHGASTVDPDPDCPTCGGEGEIPAAVRDPAPPPASETTKT
jgi:hypothetical protein